MAHFAEVENGIVRQVLVVNNETIGDAEYPESEPLGQAFLSECGFTGLWLQCSYSGSFRGAYPGVDWIYDSKKDVFIKPESSSNGAS